MTADSASPGLRRVLGFWEVTASGVGIIVGAGIYVLVGEATAEAGATVWISFLVAAVLSGLTGLSYCELAAMYPRAAAEYEYSRQAFSASVAFLVGWIMVAGLAVAGGAVSLGFARYLREFVEIPERVGALALLAVVTTIIVGGIRNSARLTLALSTVQLGGLVLVAVIGGPHLGHEDLLHGPGASGVLAGAALVFFAFIGFDEVITLAEETRDPARTVPRALLASLGISAALYVVVAIVAVSVLGAETLGTSDRPLADVLGHVTGEGSVEVIAVIALLSTTNTTLLALTAGSRLAFGMAQEGALPAWFGRVNGRGAPVATAVACALAAAACALIGDLRLVASVTDAAVYLVFVAVNSSVLVLRIRRPSLDRPFRVPLAVHGIPVLSVLGLATSLLLLTQLDSWSLLAAVVVLGLGAVAYALLQQRQGSGPAPLCR